MFLVTVIYIKNTYIEKPKIPTTFTTNTKKYKNYLCGHTLNLLDRAHFARAKEYGGGVVGWDKSTE